MNKVHPLSTYTFLKLKHKDMRMWQNIDIYIVDIPLHFKRLVWTPKWYPLTIVIMLVGYLLVSRSFLLQMKWNGKRNSLICLVEPGGVLLWYGWVCEITRVICQSVMNYMFTDSLFKKIWSYHFPRKERNYKIFISSWITKFSKIV